MTKLYGSGIIDVTLDFITGIRQSRVLTQYIDAWEFSKPYILWQKITLTWPWIL